jgi:medium-chain acyl-[acyl-carrier-protein] hydrolase
MTRYLGRQAVTHPLHLFVSGRRPPHLPDSQLPLHGLPDDAFIQGVQQRYGGIPALILQDPELLNLFLPILKADFELLESYRYVDDRPLDCSISAFGGYEDNQATQSELINWHRHTRRAFNLTMLPGNHFFIQTAQAQLIQALVTMLTPLINQPV